MKTLILSLLLSGCATFQPRECLVYEDRYSRPLIHVFHTPNGWSRNQPNYQRVGGWKRVCTEYKSKGVSND